MPYRIIMLKITLYLQCPVSGIFAPYNKSHWLFYMKTPNFTDYPKW